MIKHLSHTAKPSSVGAVWRLVHPFVPSGIREYVRRSGQYVHSRKLKDSDTLLLSYPKSGSTWLRDMLANLLAGETIRAEDLAMWVPPLHLADEALFNPRIIRSHDRIDTPGFDIAQKKIVLIRDPRSLVVSWSFHQRRRGSDLTIEQSTDLLLNDGFSWLGSWKSHVEAVKKAAEEGLLVVRYEDLHTDTSKELTRISEHLGLSLTQADIDRAVVSATPENMRKRRVIAGLEKKSENISDIRSAKTQGWRTECPVDCIDTLNSQLHSELEYFGYEL